MFQLFINIQITSAHARTRRKATTMTEHEHRTENVYTAPSASSQTNSTNYLVGPANQPFDNIYIYTYSVSCWVAIKGTLFMGSQCAYRYMCRNAKGCRKNRGIRAVRLDRTETRIYPHAAHKIYTNPTILNQEACREWPRV